jgi:hypothetical protein
MTMPINLHPQYITDENGNKISVVLPIEEFESILQNEDIDKVWEDESIKRLKAYRNGELETVPMETIFH